MYALWCVAISYMLNKKIKKFSNEHRNSKLRMNVVFDSRIVEAAEKSDIGWKDNRDNVTIFSGHKVVCNCNIFYCGYSL